MFTCCVNLYYMANSIIYIYKIKHKSSYNINKSVIDGQMSNNNILSV